MSRKKLIAIGCSYTEHYLRSDISPDIDHDFPRWPQHLADMLDMECINLGKCGSGNKQILSKIINTSLTEKNIGLVVVMWSQFQRLDFEMSDNKWDSLNLDTHKINIDTEVDLKNINNSRNRMRYNNLKELHNPHSAVQDALRTFILAENLLKDIPHLYIQGPTPIKYYSTKTLSTDDNYHGPLWDNYYDSKQNAVKSFFSSSYFNYVEKNLSEKFIGWPIFLEIGGYDVENILDKLDPEQKELRISNEDIHPNDEGHKIIAQEIYDAYAKIYL
jgi:hypothetical protein